MFFIRADGNVKIGAGHLMRCMTMGEELAALRGREAVCFVCADQASGELVRENGFSVRVLGTDYREPEQELSLWQEILQETAVEDDSGTVILVDSYFATDGYLTELRKLCYVALMDDLGEHCYPVDCVINYNAFADREYYSQLYEGQNISLLIGSSYVPVRPQFLNVEYSVRENVQDVLITTGGGDSENIAGRILERLLDYPVSFHLVTGRFSPHLDNLRKIAECYGNVQIHYDVKDMAELMKSCDLAVTAGGSTIYELAVIGVPFVCFAYAENQEPLINYLGRQEIAEVAGAWHRNPEGTLEKLAERFDQLVKNRDSRIAYHLREREMIDGRGTERLAAALNNIDFTMCLL